MLILTAHGAGTIKRGRDDDADHKYTDETDRKVSDARQKLNANARALYDVAARHADELFSSPRSIDTYETYAPNAAYFEESRKLVKATLETYAESQSPETQAMLRRQYENYSNALDNITYIRLADLVRAVKENGRLIQERGEEVCFVVPESEWYQKSNMWITLVAALYMKPALAASTECAEDVKAVHALKCTCLLFDDCIYSGMQMADLLSEARETLGTVYCVPAYWHMTNSKVGAGDIYPPVLDVVRTRSAHLKSVNDYLTPSIWRVETGQRLTYLQTKQPDNVSFPVFMWNTKFNPFTDNNGIGDELRSLYANIAENPSLTRGCIGKTSSECPEKVRTREHYYETLFLKTLRTAKPEPKVTSVASAEARLRENARSTHAMAEIVTRRISSSRNYTIDPRAEEWLLRKVKTTFARLEEEMPAYREPLAAEFSALTRALSHIRLISVRTVLEAIAENVRLLRTTGERYCVILFQHDFWWVQLETIRLLQPEFVAYSHRPEDIQALRRIGECSRLFCSAILTEIDRLASSEINKNYQVPAFTNLGLTSRTEHAVHPVLRSAVEARSKVHVAPPINTLLSSSFWNVRSTETLTYFDAQAVLKSTLPRFLKTLGSSPFNGDKDSASEIALRADDVFNELIRRDNRGKRVALVQNCGGAEAGKECPPAKYKGVLHSLFPRAEEQMCMTEYLRATEEAAPSRAEKRIHVDAAAGTDFGARSRNTRRSRSARRTKQRFSTRSRSRARRRRSRSRKSFRKSSRKSDKSRRRRR